MPHQQPGHLLGQVLAGRPGGGPEASGHPPLRLVAVEVDDTHALVKAEGRLHLATLHRLTGVLSDQLDHGHRHVRLDLTGVNDASPTALRSLARVHRQFIDAHGLLTIGGVGPALAWQLAATGLDRVLFLTDPPRPSHPDTPPRAAAGRPAPR